MPSRLLREGILESTAVNGLSFPAEVFYRRLMSVVDDFGRFDGRPAVLRGRLYALKLDTVREADISRWIAECEKAGLIALYTVQQKPYLLFLKLGPARAKQSKFPAPPAQAEDTPDQSASVNAGEHLHADVNGCAQVKSDVPYSGSYSDSSSDSDTGSVSSVLSPATDTGGKRFAPPTPEEVAAYCRERGNAVDAARFVDFYAAKGWKIGSNAMKDWRAAVRTWERNERDKPAARSPPAAPPKETTLERATRVAREAAAQATRTESESCQRSQPPAPSGLFDGPESTPPASESPTT